MSRPKKDPNAVTETYQQIADRIKSTGALSPALTAALDEVTVQLGGLEDEFIFNFMIGSGLLLLITLALCGD